MTRFLLPPSLGILLALLLSFFLSFFTCATAQLPSPAKLMITEYVEGAGRDKWLEVTNVGEAEFNPSTPRYLCVFSNQNAGNPMDKAPSFKVRIAISMAEGETLLFRHGQASQPAHLLAVAQPTIVCSFNGDDLIILSKAKDSTAWEERVDVLGEGGLWGKDLIARRHAGSQPSLRYLRGEWDIIEDLSTLTKTASPCADGLGCFESKLVLAISGSPQEPFSSAFRLMIYDFTGNLLLEETSIGDKEITQHLQRLRAISGQQCFIVQEMWQGTVVTNRLCLQ